MRTSTCIYKKSPSFIKEGDRHEKLPEGKPFSIGEEAAKI